jgi:hypothetical protein
MSLFVKTFIPEVFFCGSEELEDWVIRCWLKFNWLDLHQLWLLTLNQILDPNIQKPWYNNVWLMISHSFNELRKNPVMLVNVFPYVFGSLDLLRLYLNVI